MLPKINMPEYTLTLPHDNSHIKFRPYTVKEEKIMLMATNSENLNEIANATRQVVNSCVNEKDFDCAKLPSFVVDYIFVNLRGKSVGDSVETTMICNNRLENGDRCGTEFTKKINLNDIRVVDEFKKDRKFEFPLKGTEYSVRMRYPTYGSTLAYNDSDDEVTKTLRVVYDSIEMIYSKEEVFKMKDTTFEDFAEWSNNLTKEQYTQLIDFIENIPHFEINIKHKCTSCGNDIDARFTDILNFF